MKETSANVENEVRKYFLAEASRERFIYPRQAYPTLLERQPIFLDSQAIARNTA